MEESYETFEEELGPQRTDHPPPLKPVRQIRRPEMYPTRRIREEMPPVLQQTRAEARSLAREASFQRTTSLHKPASTQNLNQTETPWESVTLNRCLFVAITILVITSGFQRLQDTLRGRRGMAGEEEEDIGLTVRRTGTLRHRGQPLQPQPSLWEVMFWWLPDLDDDDEDEEEEDDDIKPQRSKRGPKGRTSSGLRNKPLLDRSLLKQRDGTLKDRRARRGKDEGNKEEEEREETEEMKEEAGGEDEGGEERPSKKNKVTEETRKKD